jgi:2-polyprenyl-6-hydroxyphenyl methylase / 3-demethylubiquinone-9 3-methyltransferase
MTAVPSANRAAASRTDLPPDETGQADATVDQAEIAKFAAMAEAWWDPAGKFRPLHRLNPVRLAYIRDQAAARFGRATLGPLPLAGLRLADIGCGGGLLSEPLARLGARVTGIDAAAKNITVARRHADESGLAIDYRTGTAEQLAEAGERFDIVLAMEIVEHVGDVPRFLGTAAALVAPGGMLILSTLNRTAKSFALAIVGAEYLLRWLPRGTHDWRRFLKPSEVAGSIRPHGLALAEAVGVAYSPLSDKWRLSAEDLDVNYMMRFERG